MKRQNITLYFFLVLGLVAIMSIYMANKSFKETLEREEKEKLQTKSLLRQGPIFTGTARKRIKLKETRKQQTRPEEKEIDLQQVPDDFDIEKEITAGEGEIGTGTSQEASATQTSQLKKQPSASELKELKNKGIIIF